jgi:hypothetical protein
LEPGGADQAIFDVKLYETSNPQLVQDVKFVRIAVHDPLQPTATITTPANNAHVYAGSPVVISGVGHDLDTGDTLTSGHLHWTINATPTATGSSFTHVFNSTGTYTITLTATEQAGRSGSASVTLHVDPAPPNAEVQIVSPADGTGYLVANNVSSYPVALVASGSPGMQFSWSDSLDGAMGTGSSITWDFSLTQNTNCAPWTTHKITLKGVDNLSRTATASISIVLKPSCIN